MREAWPDRVIQALTVFVMLLCLTSRLSLGAYDSMRVELRISFNMTSWRLNVFNKSSSNVTSFSYLIPCKLQGAVDPSARELGLYLLLHMTLPHVV